MRCIIEYIARLRYMAGKEFVVAACIVLCGSAPEGQRQKKLERMYDFLTGKSGGSYAPGDIIVLPNGVKELFLESILNAAFSEAAESDGGEVLLYFCARTAADLCAELSDNDYGGVEAVRLGSAEIRRDVIAYYTGLAARCDLSGGVRGR